MKPRFRLLPIAIAACLLHLAGCRTTRKDATEMETLLSAVAYESPVPRTSQSVAAPIRSREAHADADSGIVDKARSIRQAVGNGLKATAYILLYGVFKMVESALDFDGQDNSPRGRSDRNFQQWLDDRDRWRQGD